MVTVTPQSLLTNATTAVGLLTNSKKVDIVQIIDQETSKQVFSNARPIKATIKETAKISKYPVETGYTSADNRVSNPTEIEIDLLIPSEYYNSVYPQIRNAWINATLLSVQTRTGIYKNLVIENMPHDEHPDFFSAIIMNLRLTEFILAGLTGTGNLQNYAPASPKYFDPVSLGLIQGINTTASSLSYFNAPSIVGALI